jgi:superfamily II DNA or RNA helicase
MQLRPYQADIVNRNREAWAAGHQNICDVLPTGAGKTVIFGHELSIEPGVSFAIAHRQELISQMSMALARYGVKHRLMASEKLIRWIVTLHIRALGRHYYDPQAPCIVTGVRTLLNRADKLQNMITQAKLWVVDECHHITEKPRNEWGKAVALFPDTCRGLGVTATPLRADGKGLGRHANGIMDTLIAGPSGRDMINAGYLSDYRIFAPQTTIDMTAVPIGKTGDYSKPKLTTAVRKSTITGDVVEQYLKIAPGKLGVTFVTDVETGKELVGRFNGAGVPSELVHAKTSDKIRQGVIDSFSRGDLKNLINVDIFGEGFDLPAIEVCSMARPTQSYSLYIQQFGRALRIMDGKKHAIIIDHVGNVAHHAKTKGLPDSMQIWSLDARDCRAPGKKDPDLRPVKICVKCTAVYEGYMRVCPYCGHTNTPDGRASIEQVGGDLYELNASALAAMRGEIGRIDAPPDAVGDKLRHAGAPDIAILGAMKNHRLRQEAQGELRESIALWAGRQRAAGIPDYESYREFYHKYGIDVLGAQALGARKAKELMGRIR